MEERCLDCHGRIDRGGSELLPYEDRAMKREYPALTLYVVFSIAVLLIYTIVEQILSATTGISHDTLTVSVFACFGGEILACALIKIFKLKERDHEEIP